MDFIDKLLNKKIYVGEIVKLKEKYKTSALTAYDGVPTIYYDIYDVQNNKVGTCELRLTSEGHSYYYGHIGYNIIEKYRGHKYAYYACLLLFKIASEEYKMNELIITCSPNNIASYKTLEKLNGEFVERVDVPKDHELYMLGETEKCIFRFKIGL